MKAHTPIFDGDTATRLYSFYILYGFFAFLRIIPWIVQAIGYVLYEIAIVLVQVAEGAHIWCIALPTRIVYGRILDAKVKKDREEAGIVD